ncbi:hypothetical protein, partial [Phocaeicola vulgatus]|uniref:hypothetical protein n=1 Tax=Phocaeicola vulgatus TaxID=821 RepID=UPI001C6FDD9D
FFSDLQSCMLNPPGLSGEPRHTSFQSKQNLDKQKNDRFHQRKRSLLTLKNKIVLLSQGE